MTVILWRWEFRGSDGKDYDAVVEIEKDESLMVGKIRQLVEGMVRHEETVKELSHSRDNEIRLAEALVKWAKAELFPTSVSLDVIADGWTSLAENWDVIDKVVEALPAAIVARLARADGGKFRVANEYPGYVEVNSDDGKTWTFGTENEDWTGNLYATREAYHVGKAADAHVTLNFHGDADRPIPSDSKDVKAIVDSIVRAMWNEPDTDSREVTQTDWDNAKKLLIECAAYLKTEEGPFELYERILACVGVKQMEGALIVPTACPKCGSDKLTVLTRAEGGPSAICDLCAHAFNYEDGTAEKQMPGILVMIEGGLVQEVISEFPLRYRTIDMDVEGCDDDELMKIKASGSALLNEGAEEAVYRSHREDATVSPAMVKEVLALPTPAEMP